MKRFILVVFMIEVLCSCGFAEVVSFESIKTKIDVLDWTYEENKEDASVVLRSPQNDCSITFKMTAAPEEADAKGVAGQMMRADKGRAINKVDDLTYSYEYGKDSEAYVYVENGRLFAVKIDGSHEDTDKILSGIPEFGGVPSNTLKS